MFPVPKPLSFIKTIKQLLLVLLVITFTACDKTEVSDKQPTENPNGNIEAFESFEIVSNTEDAVIVKTRVTGEMLSGFEIQSHGIELYYNNERIRLFEEGILNSQDFTTVISSHLILGETYEVRPYLNISGSYVFGDFESFRSNVDLNVSISSVSPLKGFINDTITVRGENFCKSEFGLNNHLLLDGYSQNTIVESDTLIRAIVQPFLPSSSLNMELLSCGIKTDIEENFEINEPVLDSLSSIDRFVGEEFLFYGQNFHAAISKLWIEDAEMVLNKERTDIDKLGFVIPDNLPPGKLDVKIEVIDRTIELADAFQSTTPVISELDKTNTGFLDTLTIKGSYLIQGQSNLEVKVGETNQQILSQSPTEIKIIIDSYFSTENPKLELITGGFSLEENITMLPPQIISVDKDQYHLDNDFVRLRTKYFLGFASNIRVGNTSLYIHDPFEPVAANGDLVLDLKYWLDVNDGYPKFEYDKDGELKIQLSTAYGEDNINISIFPPEIEMLPKSSYYHGEYMNMQGLDFGYENITQIYIDDTLVPNTHLSDFVVQNERIQFEIPEEFLPGQHNLKIITGGQVSNILPFEIEAVLPQSLSNNAGTRKDNFAVQGQNMSGGHVKIYADGNLCSITSRNANQIEFQVPYWNLISTSTEITFKYGSQVFNLGTLNGVEPYQQNLNYVNSPAYYRGSTYFQYLDDFYFININGIHKYNGSSEWDAYETNMSGLNGTYRNFIRPSVVGDKLYVPGYNEFRVYDMIAKTWELISLDFENDEHLLHGIVVGNDAYLLEEQKQSTSFYKYNLVTNQKEVLAQPLYSSTNFDYFYYYDGQFFLDGQNKNITVYNVSSDSWTDIGYPTPNFKYKFETNLHLHNGILYYSGGTGNGLEFNVLYAYDFNSNIWTEKTYLPSILMSHAVFGKGNQLYFFLGQGQYRYVNQSMFIYNINEDLH